NLVARLQAETSSLPTGLKPGRKSRPSLLTICVGVVAVAASIIALLLTLNPKPQNTTREVARRVKGNSNLSTHMDLDTFSAESKAERLEQKSLSARTMSLSESLS